MKDEHDRLPERIQDAARHYNEPPELTQAELDALWSGIERAAFPPRFESPSGARPAGPTERRAAWYSPRNLLPLAAVLLLGVAIGRFGLPRKPAEVPAMAQRPGTVTDTMALSEPYQSTTSRYLGQTAALLVSLPAEVRAGRADNELIGRAHDLLLTTRLLLDSPASADPRIRTLFEDLELVLAQIVRLHSDESRAELDLIRQALEQRDVLLRLRNAVADFSADD